MGALTTAGLSRVGETTLTLIFGPLAERAPVPGQAFTANGLAG